MSRGELRAVFGSSDDGIAPRVALANHVLHNHEAPISRDVVFPRQAAQARALEQAFGAADSEAGT